MRLPMLLLLFALPCWAGDLRVAVAANFKPTLERLGQDFSAATGQRLKLSAASTGTLYNQIRLGAPFQLFFAADRASAQRLEASGHAVPGSRFCYARGSLVLVGATRGLEDLADPQLSLAIANPATAPYGRAAAEVLAADRFAAGSGRKLLRGANVAQAYQFWHSGGADLALLPAALVMEGGVPVPLDWYEPVEQHAVRLSSAANDPGADDFLAWLGSEPGRSLILDAGYLPCQ